MKKILALVLALMMVLGMVAAFAADQVPTPEGATADGSISIEGFDVGDVVNFFQVVEWGWINNNTTGGWKLTSAFDGIAEVQAVLDKINAGHVVNHVKERYELTEADVNAIVTAILDNNIAASFTRRADSETITETPVNPGMYIALVTPVTPGTIYNPIVVSSDYTAGNGTNEMDELLTATVGGSAKVKKKPNEVKKTTSDTNEKIKEAINSYVGETVEFDVETYIPSYLESYKNPTFYLEDYISTKGITYNVDSIVIKLNDVVADPSYYDLEQDTTKNGYKITFKSGYLQANRAPVKLTIHYTGDVTTDAEFNINWDNNDVTVVYTNGPKDELTALRDETNHYTFSLGASVVGKESESGKTFEIVKVQADTDGNPIYSEPSLVSEWRTETLRHPLAGAEFGLYTDEDCTQPYNKGRYADTTTYPEGARFTTDTDGIISFYGLAAGHYWIKETKAPTGYIRDNRAAHVEIKAEYKKVEVPAENHTDIVTGKTIMVAGYETYVLDYYEVIVNNVSVYKEGKYVEAGKPVDTKYVYDNDGPHTTHMSSCVINDSELVNPKGVELPSTGGMGTTILYIGGSILVLAAVILLVTKRRMKVED